MFNQQKISIKLLLIAALPFLNQNGFSQSTGLPFLKLGVGAHSHALGGAYMARVNDASAIYWNPSALVQLRSAEIFFYHSRFISDTSYSYVGYGHPFKSGKNSFGVAIGNFSKGTFQGRDENRQRINDFSAADSLVTLSYGKRVGTNVSLGIGMKMIQSKIQSFTSYGVAMDISSTYQFSGRTRLALGMFHLGPQMRYVGESYNLPGTFSAGITHQLLGPINLSADARYGLYDQKFTFALGGEIAFVQMASFRIGYLSHLAQNNAKVGHDSLSGSGGMVGVGMGVGFKISKRTDLDYAFVPMGELGGIHHMNLNWRFK